MALPVVLIMGPTASGKTDLAVELVERFPMEIVSVDSALVYRGMDIGTAKPDAETLRRAPHRLIDVADPAETYSAGRFRREALAEIRDIHGLGRIPLLVGGTMLYYRALLGGLAELPEADPVVRAELDARRAQQGPAMLHDWLAQVDPKAAARIHPNDPQRVQRALEVYLLTGRSLSDWQSRQHAWSFPYRALKLVVAPDDRTVLYRRIEARFHRMLARGFVDEVRGLRRRPDLGSDTPAMRAVGYRQVWEFLDGLTDYDDMVQRGVVATRRFAKRQLTWLRTEPEALWLDSESSGLLDGAVGILRDVSMQGMR